MKDTNFIIYTIKDPDSLEVRYVGKSMKGTARFRDHIKPYYLARNTTHKAKWINSVINKGKRPVFEVIAMANNNEELIILERHYIKEYREAGCNLTNGTDGGEGAPGRSISEETRQKLAEKRREWHANLDYDFVPSNKHKPIFINGIEHKHCSKCNQDKELSLFGKWKRNWDKLNHICKSCHAERMRGYRAKSK